MNEQFVMLYIPQRMKQLGVTNYYVRYRDMLIRGLTTYTIEAYNDLYFLVSQPEFIVVESDYGVYADSNIVETENTYEHRGEIIIDNRSEPNQRVRFIQVIIVN